MQIDLRTVAIKPLRHTFDHLVERFGDKPASRYQEGSYNIQQEHSAKYVYDSVYRLAQVVSNDASWGIAWTFDEWGNRLTQTPQGLATSRVGTQTLGYINNRLTTYTYDVAGNQLNDGNHNYAFNAENQITQMYGGAAVYGYDGDGRRMKKTVGSETTFYFYGPMGVICEFTTTNTGAAQAASSSSRRGMRSGTPSGTSIAPRVASMTAACLAASSSGVPFDIRNASMSRLNAAVSSSIARSSASLTCCASSATAFISASTSL